MLCITWISAVPYICDTNGSFRLPTPCSPRMVPPWPIAAATMAANAAWARSRWAGSVAEQMTGGCRLPSAACPKVPVVVVVVVVEHDRSEPFQGGQRHAASVHQLGALVSVLSREHLGGTMLEHGRLACGCLDSRRRPVVRHP